MSNNTKANICIIVALLSLGTASLMFHFFGIFGLIVNLLLFVGGVAVLVSLHRQGKQLAMACNIPVQAKVEWWETSNHGHMFFLVLSFPYNGVIVEKGYSARANGFAELTLFLNQHPIGSEITILTGTKGVSVIILAGIQLIMIDKGEKLILSRKNKG